MHILAAARIRAQRRKPQTGPIQVLWDFTLSGLACFPEGGFGVRQVVVAELGFESRCAHKPPAAEIGALGFERDDLRKIVEMVHADLGIQRGDHVGEAISELKKEASDATARQRMTEVRALKYSAQAEDARREIERLRSEVESLRAKLTIHSDEMTALAAERDAHAAEVESLREEIAGLRGIVKERDGLLTQAQDQRAEIERLKLACDTYAADWDTAGKACRIRVDEYPLSSVIRLVRDDAERAAVAKRLVKERDALRAEVADLRGTFDMVHASLGAQSRGSIG